jgi:hypothetical protein
MKSIRMRWVGQTARMEEMRNSHTILVCKSEGNRPFGRPRHRWKDNIKMDLKELGYEDMVEDGV